MLTMRKASASNSVELSDIDMSYVIQALGKIGRPGFADEKGRETLREVHRDYVAAGAQVVTANTFRTNPRKAGPRWRELRLGSDRFKSHGLDNRRSVMAHPQITFDGALDALSFGNRRA